MQRKSEKNHSRSRHAHIRYRSHATSSHHSNAFSPNTRANMSTWSIISITISSLWRPCYYLYSNRLKPGWVHFCLNKQVHYYFPTAQDVSIQEVIRLKKQKQKNWHLVSNVAHRFLFYAFFVFIMWKRLIKHFVAGNYFLSLFKSCHMLCMLTMCLSRVSTCGQGGVIKLHLPLPAPAEGCGTPTTATWPSSRTRADAASSRPSPTGRLSSRLRGSGRACAPSSAPRFRTETALWYTWPLGSGWQENGEAQKGKRGYWRNTIITRVLLIVHVSSPVCAGCFWSWIYERLCPTEINGSV